MQIKPKLLSFFRGISIIIFMMIVVKCAVFRPSVDSDSELVITRKYVGNFLDHRIAGEGDPLNPSIFWIKTSLENTYGKIGVYARGNMDFILNDRLYLRRTLYDHQAINSWNYLLESNDQTVYYKIYGTSLDSTLAEAVIRLFEY